MGLLVIDQSLEEADTFIALEHKGLGANWSHLVDFMGVFDIDD